jgi:hypothetical protein
MSNIITAEAELNKITATFAATVFTPKDANDPKSSPLLETATRKVRDGKNKDAAGKAVYKDVKYSRPVVKVTALQFAAALALAQSQVVTEHVVKQADGTEKKVQSNLLADTQVEALNDVAEDAYEAFASKGDGNGYYRSFIVGVRTNRDTEKSLSVKIAQIQKTLLDLILALNEGDWTADKAALFEAPDKNAANAKRIGLLQAYTQLNAKLNAIVDAKTKKEAAKAAEAPVPAKAA